MKAEILVRRVEQIHLGDGRYLGPRKVKMKWYGSQEGDDEDEMETLAIIGFTVTSAEYAQMAKLGMVDVEVEDDDAPDRKTKVFFRTDRDLLDEAEDDLVQEWEACQDDPTVELQVWNDLDYWEVQTIN